MRKGQRKSVPLLLRIAQSAGSARSRESSPLREVGGVSDLGPGKVQHSLLSDLARADRTEISS